MEQNKEAFLSELYAVQRNMDRRLLWLGKNGVPFITPTATPARASRTELGILEDPKWAVEWYKEQGYETVIQEKYMGSYCLVIFTDEIKAFSRGGYPIKLTDELRENLEYWRSKIPYTEKVIIEGELMPWSYLGDQLINREYTSMVFVYDNYFDPEYFQDEVFTQYKRDEILLNTKELKLKYKPHELKYFEAINKLQKGKYDTYRRQVAKYGGSGKAMFKPFHLTYLDGRYPTVTEMNEMLGIEPLTLEYAMETRSDREGVVVKPVENWVLLPDNIPHMIKCRDEEYLHLIYGAFFNPAKVQLTRSLGKKWNTQLKEGALARKLIKTIPGSPEYNVLMAEMLGLEFEEQFLDSTL